MKGFDRIKHNPLELIKQIWPEADVSHITYDPDMRKGDFDIVRQCGGDGTYLFVYQVFMDALRDIVTMRVACKDTVPADLSKIKAIHYTVGPVRHVTVYGRIYLRCSTTHKYPGQRDRVRMPVRCEYVLHDA